MAEPLLNEFNRDVASDFGNGADGSVRILVYRIEGFRFGLLHDDVNKLVRAVAVTPLKNPTPDVIGVINFQGCIIPVVSMRRKLGLPEQPICPGHQFIIAKTSKQLVALVVDSVEGILERPNTDLVKGDDVVPGMSALKGVLKLPESPIVVHDLDRFLVLSQEEKREARATT